MRNKVEEKLLMIGEKLDGFVLSRLAGRLLEAQMRSGCDAKYYGKLHAKRNDTKMKFKALNKDDASRSLNVDAALSDRDAWKTHGQTCTTRPSLKTCVCCVIGYSIIEYARATTHVDNHHDYSPAGAGRLR